MNKMSMIQKKQLLECSAKLVRETNFNESKVQVLIQCFYNCLKKDTTAMDRNTFQDFLKDQFDMTDDLLMDRVFRVIDEDCDNFINLQEFVRGVHLLTKETDEKVQEFCFKVYDLNGDGYISREEMFQFLKFTIPKNSTEEDPDEGVKDLVEIILRKLDRDNDNKVSLAEFKTVVGSENLLTECLGPILPSESIKREFMRKMFGQDSDDK